MPTFALMYY